MIALIEQNRLALQRLCAAYRVARLEVFGSAVTGEFDPARSDLDFPVEFLPGQELGPWLGHYFAFQAELERLFGCQVDLLMPGAMKNPYFIREVNRTRRPLYAA
jgi:hypothetical protein